MGRFKPNTIEGNAPQKHITSAAYTIAENDYPIYSTLVLDAGEPTVITIPVGMIFPGWAISIVDLVGGGSVVADDGVTLIAPNGAAFAQPGSIGALIGVSTNSVVLGGDTTS